MKAIVTGGTGLVGRKLVSGLARPTVLSRHPDQARTMVPSADVLGWDPLSGPPLLEGLAGADVVFNLAGESVADGRWSHEKKRLIRDSRVRGTRNLVAGLERMSQKPAVLVSASAVGFYGDRGDEELDESSPAGDGFLSKVCSDWELEARVAESLGMRVVCVRIGVVLSADGGALARMATPFKLGLGGPIAGGAQWMPWIHLDDLVEILLVAATSAALPGTICAVAPLPVTNAEFTRKLARAVRRPALMPVPKTALRLALGEMSQIVTASQRVVPKALIEAGYSFKFSQVDGAFEDIFDGAKKVSAA